MAACKRCIDCRYFVRPHDGLNYGYCSSHNSEIRNWNTLPFVVTRVRDGREYHVKHTFDTGDIFEMDVLAPNAYQAERYFRKIVKENLP